MAKKTDEERLLELEEKMNSIKEQKQKLETKLKEKERKARTRRLIQTGALIEKHFKIKGEDDVLKLIYSYKKSVHDNNEKIISLDINKVRQELGEVVEGEAKNEKSNAKATIK